MTPNQMREFRLSLGLTQRAFGVKIGLNKNYAQNQISRYESGRITITKRVEQIVELWKENEQLMSATKPPMKVKLNGSH